MLRLPTSPTHKIVSGCVHVLGRRLLPGRTMHPDAITYEEIHS